MEADSASLLGVRVYIPCSLVGESEGFWDIIRAEWALP